jgi:hypothetical protein
VIDHAAEREREVHLARSNLGIDLVRVRRIRRIDSCIRFRSGTGKSKLGFKPAS